MDTVVLQDLEIWCIIGERPDERIRKQCLYVTAELSVDLAPAIASDDLHDTVDYASMSRDIRHEIINAKCCLIERAAGIAADVCLADKRVQSVTITVRKNGSVPHLTAAAVRIHRAQNQ